MIISIFSPPSSSTICLTLSPFTPTHDPTASTLGLFDHTAIFVLEPASLVMLLISTVPSAISVTSRSKRSFTKSGCVLDVIIRNPPFCVSLTSRMKSLILSPVLYFSLGIISFLLRSVSVLSSSATLTFSPTYL